MRYWIPISFITALIFSQEALSQTTGGSTISSEDKNKNIEQLMESQSKIYESITKSLPSMTGALTGMAGIVEKLEKLKRQRASLGVIQSDKLDLKIEIILGEIDKKRPLTKFKIMQIKWQKIGVPDIDKERNSHYEKLKNELLKVVSTQ
jgi:hypothetical protein